MTFEPSAIAEVAQRKGWQCQVRDRMSGRDVAEPWIETDCLVELLPFKLTARYLASTDMSAAGPHELA